MPTITPFLWFHHQAEDAASFYLSVFPDSAITNVVRNGGQVMIVNITINGQDLVFMNGGPTYTLSPAFSLVVNCDSQTEIDHYWDSLIDGGGQHLHCGWLTDAYGVSWQVVPRSIGELMANPDADARARVIGALMQMSKIEIKTLERAANG